MLDFLPTTTDPNRLKQTVTVQDSTFFGNRSQNTLIRSLSRVVEQGHKEQCDLATSQEKLFEGSNKYKKGTGKLTTNISNIFCNQFYDIIEKVFKTVLNW